VLKSQWRHLTRLHLSSCPTAQDKSSLQVGFEQQMNTDLGISSVDAFPGSLNPLREEIECVKAGLRDGLDKAR
jgi:hypothetical protein